MKKVARSFFSGICVATLLLLTLENLGAARIPLTPEQLEAEASHVVVGMVRAIEIRSEQSRNKRPGSFDFAIYCRIAVNTLEQGEGVKPGDELVVRCFRGKTRLTMFQWFDHGGHRPIPKPGQPVRAYLRREGLAYHTVYPNGFTPMGEAPHIEPDEVRQLGRWSPPGTLLLPLELWVLVVILVFLLVVFLAFVVPRSRRRKVVRLVLAVPAALWTVGLSVGFVQWSATIREGAASTGVVIAGISLVAAFGALTGWLFLSALRKPSALAKPQDAVSGPSA